MAQKVTYGLYLESGPRRQKTMVHVPDLLGCMAVGPTTEAALAVTPDAIRAYLESLRKDGEPIPADPKFSSKPVKEKIRVAIPA